MKRNTEILALKTTYQHNTWPRQDKNRKQRILSTNFTKTCKFLCQSKIYFAERNKTDFRMKDIYTKPS